MLKHHIVDADLAPYLIAERAAMVDAYLLSSIILLAKVMRERESQSWEDRLTSRGLPFKVSLIGSFLESITTLWQRHAPTPENQ